MATTVDMRVYVLSRVCVYVHVCTYSHGCEHTGMGVHKLSWMCTPSHGRGHTVTGERMATTVDMRVDVQPRVCAYVHVCRSVSHIVQQA